MIEARTVQAHIYPTQEVPPMSNVDTKAPVKAPDHSENKPRTVGTGASAAEQEEYNPTRANEGGATGVVADSDNKNGEFRELSDYAPDYRKAVQASEDVRAEAREKLPFTKEGAEAAAEKRENAEAISSIVGYTTHPDTPVKITPEVKTPSLNDAEAKAKALNVPVGVV